MHKNAFEKCMHYKQTVYAYYKSNVKVNDDKIKNKKNK